MYYLIIYVVNGWNYATELVRGSQKKLNQAIMLIEQDGHSIVLEVIKSFTLRKIVKNLTSVCKDITTNIKRYISC